MGCAVFVIDHTAIWQAFFANAAAILTALGTAVTAIAGAYIIVQNQRAAVHRKTLDAKTDAIVEATDAKVPE